jgi:ATP-binding cassette subfamily B protein
MFVRALATSAELLVIDDLSSALDVATEQQLWQRLRQLSKTTCLVVSHRPTVLAQADQILLLEEGHLVASGRLPDLLQQSATLRALYIPPPSSDRSIVE